MVALSMWRYDTVDGAAAAGALVRELARSGEVVLHDAAVVEWEAEEGKPRTRPIGASTLPVDALGDGFWGLLFGLVFFLPLLGAATGAATGALSGALSDVGIDDSFINRVRDTVTPGSSALFVLTADGGLARLRDAFADGAPGQLVFTELTPEQHAALRTVFGD